MNHHSAAISPASERALPREIEELPLAYIEIDVNGLITRANRAALAMHHPAHGDLVGKHGWDLMAADEKVVSHAAFSAQMQSGMPPPIITRNIFDRSGSFRTYQLHRSLISDTGGRPCGMSMIAVDVTEMTAALDEARRARQWLESAMASVADAVVLTDILGVVRAVNPAAEELFGFSSAQLAGKVIEEAVPVLDYQSDDGSPFNRRAVIERTSKGTATLLCGNHLKLKVRITTSPMVDHTSGSVIGVVAFLRRIDDAA
jgi:PAS domain S-box-containing protein